MADFANDTAVTCRNAANTADIGVLKVDASNDTQLFGGTNERVIIRSFGTGDVYLNPASGRVTYLGDNAVYNVSVNSAGIVVSGSASVTTPTATITNLREGLQAHGSSTSSMTVSLANGTVHSATLSANCTLTFSGSAASVACSFTLVLKQDGTGSRTVTWPAAVDWPGGTAPTLSTAANATDVLTFTTIDNGTTWLGNLAGKAYA